MKPKPTKPEPEPTYVCPLCSGHKQLIDINSKQTERCSLCKGFGRVDRAHLDRYRIAMTNKKSPESSSEDEEITYF